MTAPVPDEAVRRYTVKNLNAVYGIHSGALFVTDAAYNRLRAELAGVVKERDEAALKYISLVGQIQEAPRPETKALMGELSELGYSAANDRATSLCWKLEAERDRLRVENDSLRAELEQARKDADAYRALCKPGYIESTLLHHLPFERADRPDYGHVTRTIRQWLADAALAGTRETDEK